MTNRDVYIKIRKNFPDLITFLFGSIYKKIRHNILNHTIYHIYENGTCLYNCLKESEFKKRMAELHNKQGITYEKLPPGIGGGGGVSYKEPEGGDSY